MKFNNLEDKCLYYRGLTDYKIIGNEYMIIMLDGHTFSKKIKRKFDLPFSDDFIEIMNKTAAYVCQNIQGAKFAFVQSDEISILVTDFDTPETDSFFGNRLCKIQSIVASMASTKFNQLMYLYELEHAGSLTSVETSDLIDSLPLYEFDCKAWAVPNKNEVFAWFLYRQNDCIKNSKQQAAQTYLSHNELMGLNSDEQIKLLEETNGIVWSLDYDAGKRNGRLIKKELVTKKNKEDGSEYYRNEWKSSPCCLLKDIWLRDSFLELIPENK